MTWSLAWAQEAETDGPLIHQARFFPKPTEAPDRQVCRTLGVQPRADLLNDRALLPSTRCCT